MSSTYDDFLKPKPSRGWSEFESLEATELLDREQASLKDEQARLKEEQYRQKREERAYQSNRRRERWQGLIGDSKQRTVFLVGFFCIALGLILYFVLPRGPNITWADSSSSTSFTSRNNTAFYTNSPAHFDWSSELAIDVDTKASYISTKLKSLTATVYSLDTGAQIGSGQLNRSVSLPGKSITTLRIPLHFEGTYSNANDTTFAHVTSACTSTSSSLGLVFSFSFDITGVVGRKGARLQDTLRCPVMLSLAGSR